VGDHELTEIVKRNVDDSINYRLLPQGGHAFASAATARLEQFAEFFHWSWRAMHEIMAERLGQEPATHRSVAEWRFPRDITSWQTALNADFVLVSFVLYGTRGHDPEPAWMDVERSTAAEGAGLTGSGSRAIACIVALNDGRVVWCNFIPNNSVTMEARSAAQSAVDVMLGDVLPLTVRP
jgi:hypothetical protein